MNGLWDLVERFDNTLCFLAGMATCYAMIHYGLIGVTSRRLKEATVTDSAGPILRLSRTVRGVIIIVISALVFGLGVYTGFSLLNEKVDCFDRYANRSADSQQIRADLNERDSNNQNRLLSKIAKINSVSKEATAQLVKVIRDADTVEELQQVLIAAGTSDAGDITEVLDDFVTEKNAIKRERAENPIPAPPRKVC